MKTRARGRAVDRSIIKVMKITTVTAINLMLINWNKDHVHNYKRDTQYDMYNTNHANIVNKHGYYVY